MVILPFNFNSNTDTDKNLLILAINFLFRVVRDLPEETLASIPSFGTEIVTPQNRM